MLEPTASSFDVSVVPQYKRGDFTVFSLLGRGGEGKVKKADHNTLGYVAIKTFFHPVQLEGKKEISILYKSRHPNIVQLFGIIIDEYDNRYSGYVMEFMQFGSLSAIIHNFAVEYDLKQVYMWIEQVGLGLKYLHDNNIIHRDIKPQNMLLASMNNLKLADFGFSRDIVEDISITEGRGTCSYMAPEVIIKRRYGKPADIYSFAISIWEMIHRLKPYSDNENSFDRQTAVLEGKRPLLDLSKIDPETKTLLQRGWDNDPTKRVTTVEMIEFAKRRSTVNIEETCQEVLQERIVEDQSTILTATGNKMFILGQDKSEWKMLSLRLPHDHWYGGFASLNGEIFIFGGKELSNKTYKYGHQKKWIPLANMKGCRRDISNSTLVFDGCIWVFGGFDGMVKERLDTVEKYIPEQDKWIQMPKMLQRRHIAAAAVCDRKIYVSGGNDNGILNSVEYFDPETNNWTMFVDLPTPLSSHSMISDGSSLIILGGYYGHRACKAVWKINPKEENTTWKPMPDMEEDHRYFSAISLENRIYVIGGLNKKTVEIFNGERWDPAGSNLPESQIPVSVAIPSHLASALLSI